MRITKIRAEVVHASIYSNYVFVIAETDEGVLGFGDATLDGLEFEVVAAVNNLGGKLVGRDVLEDDCTVSGDGGGLITAAAASGIDIAMWDLKGKALNVPIYKLLGGAKRKAIPCTPHSTAPSATARPRASAHLRANWWRRATKR